ncbi:MAG: hypothetical protein WC670_18285 [Pseudolabrys sp.]|jgi:hypothetical protein
MTATHAAAPRQLDIIADTALAADPRLADTRHSSSVTAKSKIPGIRQASTKARVECDAAGHSSSVDPRIAAVEQWRVRNKVRIVDLIHSAGISYFTWRALRRGQCKPRPATVIKLRAAMEGRPALKPPQIVVGFHRLVMQLLAIEMRFDRDTLLATDFSVQRPSNPQWLRAARIRQMAIYITAVELQVSNADLGRALGDTRANIKFARDAIEDRREDGNEIDLALAAVTLQVKAA